MNEWNNNCNFCFYFLPSICSFLYFFRGFLTFLKCFLLSIVKVFPMFIQFIKNRPANISTLFQLGFYVHMTSQLRTMSTLTTLFMSTLEFTTLNNINQHSLFQFCCEQRSAMSKQRHFQSGNSQCCEFDH